ncbi:Hpt domain-containing protein [Maricaulis sp.]|uniref:Hpt domain-containing protein n=1 Tax=Maricaulis sp. TaxID=1486257 RepID=UPI002626217D|nr:Hpt domain-containing protein [Maricaulis sp.]
MVAELKSEGVPFFDRAHLTQYTGEDEALQRELLALMLDQAQRCTNMMAAARERSEWRTAAHTLKGAARGVGAFALGQMCDEAEELPEMAWPGAAVRIAQCVEATRKAFGALAD